MNYYTMSISYSENKKNYTVTVWDFNTEKIWSYKNITEQFAKDHWIECNKWIITPSWHNWEKLQEFIKVVWKDHKQKNWFYISFFNHK